MTNASPSYDEISRLPATREAVVTSNLIDENGHMNFAHYFDLGARAADDVLQHIGINRGYREGRRLGVFAAGHHLRYYAEMMQGEKLSVHPRVLARTDKAFHVVCLLVNTSQRHLACTVEVTFVHVDLETREVTPMPDDIVSPLGQLLTEHEALEWSVPVCGMR